MMWKGTKVVLLYKRVWCLESWKNVLNCGQVVFVNLGVWDWDWIKWMRKKKKKERVLCGCEHTWRLNEMERERDSCADERWRIRMNWSLKMPKTKEFKFQTLWESTDTYMCTANEADYFFFKPWYGYGFKLWLQVKLRVLRPKIIICLY